MAHFLGVKYLFGNPICDECVCINNGEDKANHPCCYKLRKMHNKGSFWLTRCFIKDEFPDHEDFHHAYHAYDDEDDIYFGCNLAEHYMRQNVLIEDINTAAT